MFLNSYGRTVAIIHVLLVAAFGLTELAATLKSFPSDKPCRNVGGCYFKGSAVSENWHKARQLCYFLNATLPVIRSINHQEAVADYLKLHFNHNSTAWTAGKNFTYSGWTWINGKPLNDSFEVLGYTSQHESNDLEVSLPVAAYAALEKDFTYAPLAAFIELPYICQYNDTYCKSSDVKHRTDSCLRFSKDNQTWYDARYQCLKTGGDLAVINIDDHSLLKTQLTLNFSYWCGLRMKSWVWSPNYNAKSNDEIKYTNWHEGAYSRSGECIAIYASDGKWKASGCDQPRSVVCHKGQDTTSTLTTKMFVGNSQTKEDSFTSVSTESTTNGLSGSGSQSLYYAAIGAGIVITICIIVIIVFVLSTRKKSAKESSRSKFTGSSQRNDHEAYERRIASAPGTASVYERADDMLGAYAEIRLSTLDQSECQAESQQPRIVCTVSASANEPANARVNASDDMRGTYAGIPLSTHNQFEDGETSQQPGTVYAALEFEKVPDAKHVYSATPTKVGPLGGVYAVPDVKGNGTTSPGASSSHPIMVSATGDVYALPTKTTKSPTANHPGNVVYANLPAEQNVQTNL